MATLYVGLLDENQRLGLWTCYFILNSVVGSDSHLWLRAPTWNGVYIYISSLFYPLKEIITYKSFPTRLLLLNFVMLVLTLSSKDEDVETEHETKADPERLDQMVHPVAERLDILLSLLLSYIKDVCYVDGNYL